MTGRLTEFALAKRMLFFSSVGIASNLAGEGAVECGTGFGRLFPVQHCNAAVGLLCTCVCASDCMITSDRSMFPACGVAA